MADPLPNISSLRELPPDEPGPLPDLQIAVDAGDNAVSVDPITGAVSIEQPDGSVVIELAGRRGAERDKTGADVHDANLADHVDDTELSNIAEDLLQGIASDETSRTDWIEIRKKGLTLLGLKVEEPKSTPDGGSMSVVRSPLLLEAVLRFQANARAELLPSAGPVKVRNDTVSKTQAQKQLEQQSGVAPTPDESDTLAKSLEDELNHYLTVRAKEYYPDTNRLLFSVGFGGSGFKKVYRCPLRRRPVSESIDANDLIVSDAAVDLHNAGRVTHRSTMRQSVLKRMQMAGAYRDVSLATPSMPSLNPIEQKVGEVTGLVASPQLPSDYQHTIYECYCELDLAGFEHEEDDGEPSGLPLPYRVTIEKESRQILEIRRNWKEDDKEQIAVIPIVKYPFVDGLGFYGIGLVSILGNSTAAVTGAWRMAMDAGMMASFPGGLIAKGLGRQDNMNIQLAPGQWRGIDTAGMPINQAAMALPYRDVTPGLMSMMQHIEGKAAAVGGIGEIAVGEGRQDAPVGTTLALLDQATKIMAAVHKGLHQAQSEEFQLLRDLFIEDPSPLLCGNQKFEKAQIVEALKNCNLVPAADPNTPSHMHRIMQAVALKQLSQQNPQLYDARKVDSRIMLMVGVSDPDSLFNTQPAAQHPDPTMMMMQMQAEIEKGKQQGQMAKLQFEAEKMKATLQIELVKIEAQSKNSAADRASREKIAELKQNIERLELAQAALIHADSIPQAQAYAGGPRDRVI